MSLKTRSQDIQKQIDLINGYCTNYRLRKVIGMRSLSKQATNYHSELVCKSTGQIEDITFFIVECQCHRIIGLSKGDVCEGSKYTVCRHCAAAFVWSNRQSGKVAVLFDKFSDAIRYLNFGGKLVKLVSGKGEAWAVVKSLLLPHQKEMITWAEKQKLSDFTSETCKIDRELEPNSKEDFEQRVNLLRGEVKTGII